nr:PREDICTED: uncharacterized protein LOC109041135 [Bemisia tabaci]XP_018912888.1 PREDICTED: uncharacterized protein LOC109041135 [Bemisia tabaci]
MTSTILLLLLVCVTICVKSSPLPQTSTEGGNKKSPSVPGVGINTGFDEIVVESSLNIRGKQPEKRQSRHRTPLVIPHMIPKKFSESPNSKYNHTEDPAESKSSTERVKEDRQYEKPEKPKKQNRRSTTTTTTSETTIEEET